MTIGLKLGRNRLRNLFLVRGGRGVVGELWLGLYLMEMEVGMGVGGGRERGREEVGKGIMELGI